MSERSSRRWAVRSAEQEKRSEERSNTKGGPSVVTTKKTYTTRRYKRGNR